MSNKPILLIDMDEVLCEFWRPIVETCGKTVEDVTTWETPDWAKEAFAYRMTYSYYRYLKPVEGAIDAVHKLKNDWDIYIVTHTPPSNPRENILAAKRAWLEEHIPGCYLGVVNTDQKHLIRGDVIIDDRLETCEKFEELSGDAILFDRPWNKVEDLSHLSTRCRNWEEVVTLLNKLRIQDEKWMDDYIDEHLLEQHWLPTKKEEAPVKSRMDLIPPRALELEGVVMANGLEKHGEGTWKTKYKYSDHIQAACRHLNKHLQGEFINEEDGGTPHLSNASIRLKMALEKWMDEHEKPAIDPFDFDSDCAFCGREHGAEWCGTK